MADDTLRGFYVHHVTVTTRQGGGAYGDVSGEPVTVAGFLDEGAQLVRSPGGEQVVSSSRFYTDLEADVVFTAGSEVLLPGGRTGSVIASMRRDGGTLDLPDHLEVQIG